MEFTDGAAPHVGCAANFDPGSFRLDQQCIGWPLCYFSVCSYQKEADQCCCFFMFLFFWSKYSVWRFCSFLPHLYSFWRLKVIFQGQNTALLLRRWGRRRCSGEEEFLWTCHMPRLGTRPGNRKRWKDPPCYLWENSLFLWAMFYVANCECLPEGTVYLGKSGKIC